MHAIGLDVVVAPLFVTGYGLDGGGDGVVVSLERQNPSLVGWLNPDNVLLHS